MNCVLNLPRINQLNSRQVYQQIFSEKSLRDIRELQLEQSTKFGGKQHINRLEVTVSCSRSNNLVRRYCFSINFLKSSGGALKILIQQGLH